MSEQSIAGILKNKFWNDLQEISKSLCEKHRLRYNSNEEGHINRWISYVLRLVEPKERSTDFSKGFWERIPEVCIPAVKLLADKFEHGENVNPYQSRTIKSNNLSEKKRRRTDLLWADWKIHHFHLSTSPSPEDDGFYPRSDYLLFAIVRDDYVYFLDVKLMDIPNTVAKASENIIKKGADFFNIHALGGKEMMQKCVESANLAAEKLGRNKPTILAVTILTSISDEKLHNELEINQNVSEYALKLAKLAKEAGVTGVVASVFEAKRIKENCGKDFKVLCPGIRPVWSAKNDQQRLATPTLALNEGADYLVIGRAVTAAPDRVEAMKKIYEEIEEIL